MQKSSEILQMDDPFKEAFGSSNIAWHCAAYRAREELGIDMDGNFLLLLFFNYVE